MEPLRRAKSERGGHRGIVTKTIAEIDVLLANPADPNDPEALTKQLKSINVCKTKLERERDVLPAFDEKVQAALTDEQELEDDIINADDIQTNINWKVLALEELASRLLRGPTPQPPAGSSRAPTPVQLQLADASPPQSRPPSPLPVVAPATNTATQPPNNVRLPKLTLPKFSGASLE